MRLKPIVACGAISPRAGVGVLIASALVLTLATEPHAEQKTDYCLPFKPTAGKTYGYSNRDTRCEGVHDRKNAASTEDLVVASLTLVGDHEQIGKATREGTTLPIVWRGAQAKDLAGKELSLEGISEHGGDHYRMNTHFPVSSGHYDWPTEVLHGIPLPVDQVFLRACFRIGQCIQGPYLPVQVGQFDTPVTKYQLRLIPSSNVKNVSYDLEERQQGTWKFVKAVSSSAVFRAAGHPFLIDVPLADLPSAATYYRLKITAFMPSKNPKKNP